MSITVGDMFAGIGGIALAFKQAGFDVAWANDLDVNASKTYSANFDHKFINKDICKVDSKELDQVDVITSGSPCQSFSLAGNRQGFNDSRGNLFFETVRVINALQPKAFLIENVKNLASHDKGKTLSIIKDTIVNDLQYSFTPFILSAYKHGNIPQARERIYIVGFRKDIVTDFNVPSEIPLTTTIKDCLLDGKQLDKYYFKEEHKYIPFLKDTIKSRETLYQWRRVYVRENKNNLCPTLTANMGSGGHNVPLLVDDFGFRKLTPRECFRFQGFPDSFVLPATISDSSLYKQVGNSVTVTVVKRIADEIYRVLSRN